MCGAVGEEVEWRLRGREGLGHVGSAEFEVSVSSSGRVKAHGRRRGQQGFGRASRVDTWLMMMSVYGIEEEADGSCTRCAWSVGGGHVPSVMLTCV